MQRDVKHALDTLNDFMISISSDTLLHKHDIGKLKLMVDEHRRALDNAAKMYDYAVTNLILALEARDKDGGDLTVNELHAMQFAEGMSASRAKH